MEGIERVVDTESRIEDHRSCGGCSGVDDREASIFVSSRWVRYRLGYSTRCPEAQAGRVKWKVFVVEIRGPKEVRLGSELIKTLYQNHVYLSLSFSKGLIAFTLLSFKPSLVGIDQIKYSLTSNTTTTNLSSAHVARTRNPGIPSYSDVHMAAAMAVPQHSLTESPNSRGIEVFGWNILACTNPISNAPECDALQASLGGIPLPEMTFGNNSLELRHKSSGWKLSFDTKSALRTVKNGALEDGDGGVKVGHADVWLRSR